LTEELAPTEQVRRGRRKQGWTPAEHGTQRGPLQPRVARGLTWTLIDTWGTQILGLIVFAILTNLLQPDQFGLVALATVFVSFAQLFVDQGLGDALIQRKSVTRSQIDTAFWVAVGTGSLLTLVGIALAGPISSWLNEPDLGPILQVLSFIFVLVALSSIQTALLRREMRFRGLAIRRLAAVIVGGVVGVSMAFAGYGAWSLVGQQLASAATTVVTLWTVSPWRPGLQVERADFRSLFAFGINVVGSDILTFLSRNVDRLLIGAVLGTTSLGFYAVAYRILDTSQNLLVSFARKLAFPIFAQLQHDLERLRRAYGSVTRALSVVMLPGYIGLSLVAQEAIVVIFGKQWAESGPVAAILFLIGPVLTIQLFTGALLNGVGHPEITFRIRLVTTAINVIGFFIAVFFYQNIIAVAAAFVIRGYLVMPLILWATAKYAHIDRRSQLIALRGPAIATAFMAIVVIGVKLLLLDHVPTWQLLVIEVAVGIISFVLALLIVDPGLIREVLRFALLALPGGRRLARRFGIDLPTGRRRAALEEEALDEEADAEGVAEADAAVDDDVSNVGTTARERDIGGV
jgi:O-antigen/teichoic acid export membrane protein